MPRYVDVGADPRRGALAIIGDTQRTMYFEQLIGRESNDAAREALLRGLADERPAGVMILGDIVSFGASAAEWRYFDRAIAPLQARGTPMVALLGNHDYYGPNRRAVTLAGVRFPTLHTQRWFVWRFGALAVICLDSNRRDLGMQRWRAQLHWLRDTMAEIDQDADVRGVLLLCHHPPFCNSIARRESAVVRHAFQPCYAIARKALAFVSGHAHTYEHLLIDARHYIVTGGGGGPRDPVRLPSREKYRSLHTGPAVREFHYLLLEVESAALRITVKGFSPGAPALRVIDSFELEWPKAPRAHPTVTAPSQVEPAAALAQRRDTRV